MIRSAKSLKTLELRARDGVLGKVKDLYFDDRHWILRYVVVETGTWLNSRKVLISTSVIDAADWARGELPVNLTQEQVRQSPSVNAEREVSRDEERGLRKHYGWPVYWPDSVSALGPSLPVVEAPIFLPVPATAEAAMSSSPAMRRAPEGDPRLRRGGAVIGYRLEATDGTSGHIDDFLFEDHTWHIPYLVIDPRAWLPGGMVVISPDWISAVSWTESRVYIDLTRDAIKTAPAYEPEAAWDADYVERLKRHHTASLPAGES
jgi:hypothetical protein